MTVVLPHTIRSGVVSVSASSPYSWTETLPLQYSKRLQHSAHEAADEAALSQCAAHVRTTRCVSKCLSSVTFDRSRSSPDVFCILHFSRSQAHMQQEVWDSPAQKKHYVHEGCREGCGEGEASRAEEKQKQQYSSFGWLASKNSQQMTNIV